MAGDAVSESGRGRILWRTLGWGGAGILLLAPLVAMQFTDEVDWDVADFAFMGVLMGGIGIGVEAAVRSSSSTAFRVAVGLGLLLTFLTIWLNGAVGIIGSENEDANLLFWAVLTTALLGALAGRFRARGMAWAMAAAALVQLLVPFIAFFVWPDVRPALMAREVFVLTGLFTSIWLLAAGLFCRAAAQSCG